MKNFNEAINARRCQLYRLDETAHRVTSYEEARDFINEMGFCLLFGSKTLELPSLWQASDREVGQVWNWKDDLPAERLVYYGKVFRRKPGFVALDQLPALYALSPLHDCGGDRFELFSRGILNADANRIAGIVAAKGPLSTRELRRELGMAGKQHKSRFDRALAEADTNFLIAMTDIAGRGIGAYSYLWDTFERTWPEIVPRAQAITTTQAVRTIITRYVNTVQATTAQKLAALFDLDEAFVDHTGEQLAADGAITRLSVEGVAYLASQPLADTLAD